MLTPEDNIDFNNKSVVYENKTYKRFEILLQFFKYWEGVEILILFPLIIGTEVLTVYLIDFLLYFQTEFTGLFLDPYLLINHGHVIFFIILLISSYQIYRSIVKRNESQKMSARFYIFQSIKILIYFWTKFNLLLFFAIIGILRIVVVLYFSHTKSFK